MRYSDFDQRLAALGALPVHRSRIGAEESDFNLTGYCSLTH